MKPDGRRTKYTFVNEAPKPAMSIYTEKVKEGTLLLSDKPAAAQGHDLSTANGASMLTEFKKVVDVETAQVWVNKYGFPWVADRVHCYEFEVGYGVLVEDMIERAASLSLLSRLVGIAKGTGRITHKDVLAWPLASSPLADGWNLLQYNTWPEIAEGTKRIGRENAKDMFFGRASSAQDLAVAFMPDAEEWRGFLLPHEIDAGGKLTKEEAALSGVDFVPLFVPSEVGAKGFEAVVRYAACSVVSELLPRLIRGIVLTVRKATSKADFGISPSRSFPTPMAVMGYELYKGLSKQTDWLLCPRCGDFFSPRRKDQQSCGKDACSKWVQRRK